MAIPNTPPITLPVWREQNTDGSVTMTVDSQKHNQAAMPTATAMPDAVSLFEQINTSPSSWYMQLLIWCFFSIPVSKDLQKQLASSWQDRRCTSLLCLRGVSIFQPDTRLQSSRDLDCLPFPKTSCWSCASVT